MKLCHPDRNSPQYAYSERDIAWLEKQGWKRIEPIEQKAEVKTPVKRGRPRKEQLTA